MPLHQNSSWIQRSQHKAPRLRTVLHSLTWYFPPATLTALDAGSLKCMPDTPEYPNVLLPKIGAFVRVVLEPASRERTLSESDTGGRSTTVQVWQFGRSIRSHVDAVFHTNVEL